MLGNIVYMFRYIAVILITWLSLLQGSFLEYIPVNLLQPDGSKIPCFSSGDEYYVRLHNAEDYTIMQNTDDGFYYYAKLKQ